MLEWEKMEHEAADELDVPADASDAREDGRKKGSEAELEAITVSAEVLDRGEAGRGSGGVGVGHLELELDVAASPKDGT